MSERILITGISGNLGQRLAPLLSAYTIIGLDLHSPRNLPPGVEFIPADLAEPATRTQLANILREKGITAVIHLAFVIDPVRTGVTREDRMWQINVAGTRRLLEAVEEVNRTATQIRLFLFPSSVSAYGPSLPAPVDERASLGAHTLPYAVHKKESDEICQQMYPRLNGCAMYVLRPHVYAGRSMDNFILRALRGEPSGRGVLARLFLRAGWKVPVLLPAGEIHVGRFQYVHVDDMARLLAWIVAHYRPGALELVNVAGHGEPSTIPEALALSRVRLWHLRSYRLVEWCYGLAWSAGLSGVPPTVLPYFVGTYLMKTDRLRALLGSDYATVIRFSSRQALADSFQESSETV